MSEHAFEPAKDTATHILDAAYTLFLEFGLRKTTMEDVAKRANMGRITVYRHYADKPTLFQAVVMRECFRSMQEVERMLAQINDMEERFVSGFVIVVNGARKHPLISRLLETEPEWLLPYLTTKGEAMLRFGSQYVASTLRQDIDQSLLATKNVDLLAEMLWRLLHSILLTPGGLMAPPNDDDALRHVARSFLLPIVMRK
jgi:AcrR family transcriptional regulator